MSKASGNLTVYFENPFWVGVFERVWEGKLTVCKVTFGAEPKDCEIYEFILKSYDRLPFSPAVDADRRKTIRNPKRARREAGRQTGAAGIGTKSQQALQLQREQMKTERRELSREQREEEKARRFQMKSQKRKEKHKGK